jgi:hypothetical protein
MLNTPEHDHPSSLNHCSFSFLSEISYYPVLVELQFIVKV